MFARWKCLLLVGLTVEVLLLSGCSSTPVDPGFAAVEAAVSDRTGQSIAWRPTAETREVETRRLLADSPLGIDAAVRIALLNDPSLQARFEELGIAAADLQQAGLPGNPVLGAHIGLSNLSGTVPQIGFELMTTIGELLTRSARQRIAATALQSVQMELAGAVIQRIADVQHAYYEAVAARQVAALRREIDEAADARHELAMRYFGAGNLSDLDLAREAGDRELAAVERLRTEGEEAVALARLQRSMGIAGQPIDLQVPNGLPALPASDPSVDALLAQATSDRPDLIAARHRLEAATRTGDLARRWRYLGTVEGGVAGVRETDRERVIGPQLQIGLPLFDRRDAQIARHDAEQRQAASMLLTLEQQLQAEVREQRLTLDARRLTAERYRTGVIPAHEKIVEVGQRYNNYMLIGVFELLAARQAGFGVYESYLGAVRDYWLARVDLQRSLGGRPIDGPLPDGLVVLPEIEPPTLPAHRHGDGEPAPGGASSPPSEVATPMHRHGMVDDDVAPAATPPAPGDTHEHH